MDAIYTLFFSIVAVGAAVAFAVVLTTELARKLGWSEQAGAVLGVAVGLIALAPLILSGLKAVHAFLAR